MKHLKDYKMFEDVYDDTTNSDIEEKDKRAGAIKAEDITPIDHTAEQTDVNDEPLNIPSTPESEAKTKLAEDLKCYLNAMLKKHGYASFEECKKGTPQCAAFEEDAKKGWIKEVGPTPYGKEVMAEFGVNCGV
jgi:hypothetical protein